MNGRSKVLQNIDVRYFVVELESDPITVMKSFGQWVQVAIFEEPDIQNEVGQGLIGMVNLALQLQYAKITGQCHCDK